MKTISFLLSHIRTGPQPFTIGHQIASGCSNLVYSAERAGIPCVVKELFPLSLREKGLLTRTEKGRIALRKAPAGSLQWFRAWCRCLRAGKVAFLLREEPRTMDAVVGLWALYVGQGTIYTVTEGLDGTSWDAVAGETPEQILQIGYRIATLCEEVHRMQWLLVDIKASNFLVEPLPRGDVAVRLADFDSMIPCRRIRYQKSFLCSSETAPAELIACRNPLVGFHSDVYSICAMLFRKLGGDFERERIREGFISNIQPRLLGWSKERCNSLLTLFLHGLEPDPKQRLHSCRVLADRLGDLLTEQGSSL